MIKEMKQKSLQKKLVLALMLFVAAAVAMWVSDFAIFTFIGGPKHIMEIPVDELSGQYVEADLGAIYDYYAYTEKTKNGVSEGIAEKEYIVPVGTLEFMGVAVKKERIAEAEGLLTRTTDYINEKSGDLGESVHVCGYIGEMDAQTRGFYEEAVGYSELSEDVQKLFLPLVLHDGVVAGTTTVTQMWACTVIAAALIAFGLFGVIKAAAGGYQNSVRKLCAASADPETTMERLERFYEETQPIGGIRADESWVMLQNGVNTQVFNAQDIAWVHMSTVQHRVYFVPAGKTHALAVWTRNGKRYEVPMPKQAEMEQAQEHLFACLPEAVFGYSAELMQHFNRDRASFPDIARQQHEARAAGAGAAQGNVQE